jgi:DUF4097 and DUF4098 domain-containing protein YvlB
MQQTRFQMRGLRRGSVLGPLLLIASGVLFLLIQTGRIDHARFWLWYGHWWPLLLVAAGVVLLAEWGFDQIHLRDPQRTPYRRSIGGGVVLLLLIFAVVGVIGHHIAAGERWANGGWQIDQENLDELLGVKHESDQTLDLALATGSAVSVVNPHGGITVAGTSDDGRVHIAIHKQVYAMSDAEDDAKEQHLTPQVNYSGTTLSLNVRQIDGGIADLTITVPATTSTSVHANHGDIHVATIKAPVWAIANHGDIELSAISGPATAHIDNHNSSISAHDLAAGLTFDGRAQDVILSHITGSVSVYGVFYGTTRMDHINGTVHLHSALTDLQMSRLDGEVESVPGDDLTVDQAVGPFTLTTNNRNISLSRISGEISVKDSNGTIHLTAAPPLNTITLDDTNGTVDLIVPERAGFAVEANTTNGQIESGFPLSASGAANRRSLNGIVGAGGPSVHITTSNGDISISKGAVEALPASPPAAPKLTLAPATQSGPAAPAHSTRSSRRKSDQQSEP